MTEFKRKVTVCSLAGDQRAELDTIFDTGASHTVVKPGVLKEKMPWASVQKHRVPGTAKVPGRNGTVQVKESASCTLKFGECEWPYPEWLRVVDHGLDSELVIGADFLEKMGFDFTLRENPEDCLLRITNCEPQVLVTGIEVNWRRA